MRTIRSAPWRRIRSRSRLRSGTSASTPPDTIAVHGSGSHGLDHPHKVVRAAILDIIPQHHLLNNVTRAWGTFSWHWFFMIQPYDFPERLMSADPDFFIEKKLAKTAQGLSFFDPRTLVEYKRYFRNPATVHAIDRKSVV